MASLAKQKVVGSNQFAKRCAINRTDKQLLGAYRTEISTPQTNVYQANRKNCHSCLKSVQSALGGLGSEWPRSRGLNWPIYWTKIGLSRMKLDGAKDLKWAADSAHEL